MSVHIPGFSGMPPGRFIRTLGHAFLREDFLGLAAQLAYFGILAVFPFAIFLMTVLGFLPIPGLLEEIFRILRTIMPSQAAQLFFGTLSDIVITKRGGLLAFSLGGSLLAASSGISALMNALNRAYGVAETRSWLRRKTSAIVLTIVATLMIIVATTALMFGPDFGHAVSAWFHLDQVFDLIWRLVRWPVTLLTMSLLMAFLYWVCPAAEHRFRILTPGSVLSVVLWVAVSLGFGTYAEVLGHYNRTYGALGAGIVLLVWIYLSGLIVLGGGVVNAVIWRYGHGKEES